MNLNVNFDLQLQYRMLKWNLILKLILRWKNRFSTYSISFWFYIQHLSWSRNHPTWHDYLHWLWFISHITRTLGIRKLYQRLYRSVLSNSSGPSFLSSSSIYVYVLMYVLYHPMYNLGVNCKCKAELQTYYRKCMGALKHRK